MTSREHLQHLLDRDGPVCVWCGADLDPAAARADDLLERGAAANDPDRRVISCKACLTARGARGTFWWACACEERGGQPRWDIVLARLETLTHAAPVGLIRHAPSGLLRNLGQVRRHLYYHPAFTRYIAETRPEMLYHGAETTPETAAAAGLDGRDTAVVFHLLGDDALARGTRLFYVDVRGLTLRRLSDRAYDCGQPISPQRITHIPV